MMEAYSVPTICSAISNQSIKVALEEYPHLCSLNLADSSTLSADNDVEVDILIGADYYWKFLTGTIKRGNKPGSDSTESALTLAKKIKTRLLEGGFNMRK